MAVRGRIDASAGWSKLLPRLAACYRAISVEHRGHGRLAEAPLGYDPIIEVEAVFTAALQKAVVRSNSDLLMRWSAIRDVRRGGA